MQVTQRMMQEAWSWWRSESCVCVLVVDLEMTRLNAVWGGVILFAVAGEDVVFWWRVQVYCSGMCVS